MASDEKAMSEMALVLQKIGAYVDAECGGGSRAGGLVDELADSLAALEAERDALRSRLYTASNRKGSFTHSTACATWGDDGQGHVRDNAKHDHPRCNCGCAVQVVERERDALREALESMVEEHTHNHQSDELLERCRAEFVRTFDDARANNVVALQIARRALEGKA